MIQVDPPHDPYAPGWEFTEYSVGYFASVELFDSKTLKLSFAPGETGKDSGLYAVDHRVLTLSYSIYLPTTSTSFRIPGGIEFPSIGRAPGWNDIEITPTEVMVNGNVSGLTGDPTDLSCWSLDASLPSAGLYILMDSFAIETVYDKVFQTHISFAQVFGNSPDPPERNGQLTIEAVSNTELRFSVRGTDGIVRSATLPLS